MPEPLAAPAPPARRARSPIAGLLVAQFIGAFNDNAYKMMVALLAIDAVQSGGEAAVQSTTTLTFVVFTLPLMLFALPALGLADRISKRSLVLATKGFEILLMLAGTLALAWQPSGWLPLVVLAGLGAQSALFSPAKYGLLPEVLPHERLSSANGQLEAASFLAIILGIAAGGLLLQAVGIHLWVAGALLLALAILGFGASLSVPRVAASGTPEPFARTLRAAWATVRQDRALWLAAMGSMAFWGIASLLGQNVLVYGKQALALSDTLAGLPFVLFAIGIAGGALLVGRLSRGKVEIGWIPLGALGLALGTAVMGLARPGSGGTFALMALLGVASAFIVVPLNTLVQWRAPAARRGAVIALINGLSFGGLLLGNLGCGALAALGADSSRILLIAAVLVLIGTGWAVRLLPDALLRLVILLLAATLYRVRILGAQRVPTEGGALLVPNHVSFLDGLFLLAAIDRPIRFLVDQYWYERPYLRPFLASLGAIPISAGGGPRVVLRALRRAGQALDEGEVVCLFAEGEISRTGSTLPFRRGFQRIARGRAVPIVPVHLDRVYGSFLSPRAGRVQWWPTRVPCPVTVSFGEPLPSDAAPEEIRRRVDELGEHAWQLRAEGLRPLHHALVRAVRRAPWRACLADSQGRRLSRLGMLAGAVLLARRLREPWAGQGSVGVLLPPSIGGALGTIAASLSGRTSVPLNFTVGPAALASAARQAGLSTVLTSRVFLERAKLELPAGIEPLLLEDLLVAVPRGERLAAAALALLSPTRLLERACGAGRAVRSDDVATVIFSSGSTGEPKGVELTHANVQSNCDGVAQLIPLDGRDRLVGVLPLFHSFGNMALWYALQQGAGIVFHPNPLDAAAVGDLVATHRATILLATPTFLQLYARRCEPGQLGSLRVVLTGAEKLTEALADSFADRFGIRPIQGYGCTECSPVVATSTPGYRAAGFYQAGSRRGSVGRPLPGVVVRIVDPETRAPLPVGETGLVLVRGPNVMRGYLGREDLTASALHEGAYITGDIGRLDAEGFLYLTDRLSRFSKIGGEMVPHGLVEEHLQSCSGREERAFAVCGVPDERKGERLMVLSTVPPGEIPVLLEALAGRGLPALFLPRPDQVVHVEALPLLGTGKLDLQGVRARCLAAATPAAMSPASATPAAAPDLGVASGLPRPG